jgi:hypothetical protein
MDLPVLPRVVACVLAIAGVACSSSSSPSASARGTDAAPPDDAASEASPTDAVAGDSASPAADATSPGDASPSQDASSGPPADGGLPDAYGPVEDGGEFVQFIGSDKTTYFDPSQQTMPTGTITFGVDDPTASDGKVATLTRTGGQTTLGTGGAEEIVSHRSFSYGTFRYRFQLASCTTSEDLVDGIFTYFNDGSTAPDGLTINREVDIEILCGEPWLINLTIWTEYDSDTQCKNQSRVIDTRTGTVFVYANDQSSGDQTGMTSAPQLMIPGFPAAATFYEMGFTWAPDHLTYFMNVGGSYVTLWDATDATRIPQAPMLQHFNLWAPGISWSTGNKEPPPANDSTLTLDWFRYDPL